LSHHRVPLEMKSTSFMALSVPYVKIEVMVIAMREWPHVGKSSSSFPSGPTFE